MFSFIFTKPDFSFINEKNNENNVNIKYKKHTKTQYKIFTTLY